MEEKKKQPLEKDCIKKEYMTLAKEIVLHADKNICISIDDETSGFNFKGKIEIIVRPATV